MKEKLAVFTRFANSLYPHETTYLLREQNFTDDGNLEILIKIDRNSKYNQHKESFDPEYDKRKYSNLKKWIVQKLEAADVDVFFNWLLDTDKLIMTDSIATNREKQVLKYLKQITPRSYYFMRFYELLQHYRDFLLIRTRVRYYEQISDYLERFAQAYNTSVAINEDLNRATREIMGVQHADNSPVIEWESPLTQIFENAQLDGFTRYRAIIRLTYLYYNYNKINLLEHFYAKLDALIAEFSFYSKRILANYYANKALMYVRMDNLAEAEKFAYWSIRQKNNDYLYYLNNLLNILHKQQKYTAAYEVSCQALVESRNNTNYYNKVGFAALYIRTLVYNQKTDKALSYAGTFLDAYKQEIFDFRWHLFFSAYFQVLFKEEHFSQIRQLTNRFRLIEREEEFLYRRNYIPELSIYYGFAKYMQGKTDEPNFAKLLISGIQQANKDYRQRMIKLLKGLQATQPGIIMQAIKLWEKS